MLIKLQLRLENAQVGNTWYSGTLENQPDIQVYMPYETYIALGSTEYLQMTLEPVIEK